MENEFQSAYQEEQHRLSLAMEEIDRRLERLRNTPVYTGHDFTEQVLESAREEKRQALVKAHRSLILVVWILTSVAEGSGSHFISVKLEWSVKKRQRIRW